MKKIQELWTAFTQNKKVMFITIGVAVLALILIVVVIALNSRGKKEDVAEALNEIVEQRLEEWKEIEYARPLSMFDIQYSLAVSEKYSYYVIVASGDQPFSSSLFPGTPGTMSYMENVSGYTGHSYSNTRMLEASNTVKYAVVYNLVTRKFFAVDLSYKTFKLEKGATQEYPVFSNRANW